MLQRNWDTEKHPGPGVWVLHEDGTVSPYEGELSLISVEGDTGRVARISLDPSGLTMKMSYDGPSTVGGDILPEPESAWNFLRSPSLPDALDAYMRRKNLMRYDVATTLGCSDRSVRRALKGESPGLAVRLWRLVRS